MVFAKVWAAMALGTVLVMGKRAMVKPAIVLGQEQKQERVLVWEWEWEWEWELILNSLKSIALVSH